MRARNPNNPFRGGPKLAAHIPRMSEDEQRDKRQTKFPPIYSNKSLERRNGFDCGAQLRGNPRVNLPRHSEVGGGGVAEARKRVRRVPIRASHVSKSVRLSLSAERERARICNPSLVSLEMDPPSSFAPHQPLAGLVFLKR